MLQTMLAIFNDPTKRDQAVAAAKEKDIDVMWTGSIAPVLQTGPTNEEGRPFCLFRGDMMASLTFMQNGAMSCGQA